MYIACMYVYIIYNNNNNNNHDDGDGDDDDDDEELDWCVLKYSKYDTKDLPYKIRTMYKQKQYTMYPDLTRP